MTHDDGPNSAPTDPPIVTAVDIGGTKLASAVVDRNGQLLAVKQTPTVGASAEELFGRLVLLIDETLAESSKRSDAIGVGCGGPMSDRGESVSPLNIPQWRRFPLRERLQSHYGLPTFIDNDAKALALGEGWLGAARGEQNYLAMVVSTGVGGGIVLNGRLLDGASGNAGHIGHLVVDPLGRGCACGSRGCLEAEASGTAIAAITGREPADAPVAVRHRTGLLVGRAVASVAALLDLPLAVIAGSVALGFGDAFFEAAQREADRCARLEFCAGLKIVPAGNGRDGPLIGAAAVARVGLPAE